MDFKNIVTNIIGFCLILFEPLNAYLAEQPFEWGTFVPLVLAAILSYFTGKGMDGKTKAKTN